jgi:hypothetical protein
MSIRKKTASFILSSLLVFVNAGGALAASFSDVKDNYWASKEIKALVEQGVIQGYPDGSFKPENSVTRSEFAKMVIKALDKDTIEVLPAGIFYDLANTNWAYDDIIRAANLGLVFGYPDKTFKPEQNIIKSEGTSVISKTIDEKAVVNVSDKTLSKFMDTSKIPDWAKMSYLRAVPNGLYVNHPDEKLFMPQKNMTRAEAAVLLYKIRENPKVIADAYKGPDLETTIEKNVMLVEHLPTYSLKAAVNEVQINGSNGVILTNNIFPARFDSTFKSKNHKKGDIVYLIFDKDITTVEGTRLIPAGSKMEGSLLTLRRGKPFHINGKADFIFTKLITPSGKTYELQGKVANTEILSKKFGAGNLTRLGVTTASMAATGTLIGMLSGISHEMGDGAALGAIIGSGSGAVIGLMMPGLGVVIPTDKQVFVKLEKDLNINIIK